MKKHLTALALSIVCASAMVSCESDSDNSSVKSTKSNTSATEQKASDTAAPTVSSSKTTVVTTVTEAETTTEEVIDPIDVPCENKRVSFSDSISAYIDDNGDLYTWGENRRGQL